MNRLAKFARLSPLDRSLFVRAMLWSATIRLGLWLVPFRFLRRFVDRARNKPKPAAPERPAIDRIVRAVNTAGHYVPRSTCLTRALAAQVLLGEQGYPSQLRIGFSKSEAGIFQAHAWVESQARIVIGEAEARDFVPFPALESERL
jgi:hypothetical protein